MNYLSVKHNKKGDEFVECPLCEKLTSINVCNKCEFLRISLVDKVKCTWSPEKEESLKRRHNYLPESYMI